MVNADIAIITAREDEFGSVLDRLDEYLLDPFRGSSGRTYASFSVPNRMGKDCSVVLARCFEQGNDVSQQVVGDMLRDLDPQLLLVVGIAGGVPHNEFTLGDVIVSSRIHNFNVNAFNGQTITFDVKGGIHPFASDIAASLPMYKNSLAGWNTPDKIGLARPSVDLSWVAANVYGDLQWRESVLKSLNAHFGELASPNRLPLCKPGSIASSNSLMKNTEIPTKWLEDARSILAVEMEAAGAFQATQQINKQYPVLAIRGISDIIGLKRDERWTSYACQSVGAFTVAFIKAGIIEPRNSNATSIPARISDPTSAIASQESKKKPPLDVFISYSADDEQFKKELETHLTLLKREGTIRPWHSQQTAAGLERKNEIANLIDRSQIVLLLISPSFLASDDLYEQEMLRAMARHESNNARVIPIIIRPANMGNSPFNKLQGLPRNGQAVSSWGNRDEIWTSITRDIQDVCNDLCNDRSELVR